MKPPRTRIVSTCALIVAAFSLLFAPSCNAPPEINDLDTPGTATGAPLPGSTGPGNLDISGPRVVGDDAELVTGEGSWRIFKGTEAPPAKWAQRDFDDSAWLEGNVSIGYSDALDYTTKLNDMQDNYVSVFTRHVFDVEDPGPISELSLGIRYDDGFIAYINGA